MENKIVLAMQMLAKSRVDDRPKVLETIYERFGLECEAVYIQSLNDSNPKLRICAMNIIEDIKKENSVEYIYPLLNDRNFWVRRAANKCAKKYKK
jgi:3-methyladenine DNA glycosylase AlkD